jgi:Flp pilus assembly protein TadD
MTDSKTTIEELFASGRQFLADGQAIKALECFHQALELAPHNPTLLQYAGVALHELGSYEEATSCFNQSINYAPEFGETYNNLGNSLLEMEHFEDAEKAFSTACRLMPASPIPLTARATILMALGKVHDAEVCCRNAICIDSSFAEAHWNLSLCLLLQGKFSEGWQEHEWRWQKRSFTSPRRHTTIPLWDGTPQAGKTILLHAEQGFGDASQFVR